MNTKIATAEDAKFNSKVTYRKGQNVNGFAIRTFMKQYQ